MPNRKYSINYINSHKIVGIRKILFFIGKLLYYLIIFEFIYFAFFLIGYLIELLI